ncbi:MAG: 1-acyl-sn-glycerol-3-phosphate acyltransferase [Planctomycetota bacterium]|nr:MAG: 1-acyl-sn-glycerol-3-phosphate acyltransferase [Planctomycetota bacterium]
MLEAAAQGLEMEWHYEPAQDLEQPLIERLRNFPRQPDMLVYGARVLAATIIRGWLRLYRRLEIIGRENLPADRSFILVANHASHLDTLCLLAALPLGKVHRAFPAAAKDYFFVTVPRLLAAAVVINALPFDRQIHLRQSLSLCKQLLENPGNILVIFPEGTRSVTGELGPFKPGVGLLAAGTRHPVVPCYLHGTYRAWPKGCWFPRPRQVRLFIGQPRTFSEWENNRASAHQICQELHDAVQALAPGARPSVGSADKQEVAS